MFLFFLIIFLEQFENVILSFFSFSFFVISLEQLKNIFCLSFVGTARCGWQDFKKSKTIIIIKTHTLALASKKRTARCGWQNKTRKMKKKMKNAHSL